MGFEFNKDEYKGGGSYLSGDEKKSIAEAGVIFKVTGIDGPKQGNYGTEYELTLEFAGTDDERVVSFGEGMKGRWNMLGDLKRYLDQGNPAAKVRLVKVGRGYTLEGAEDAAAAAAPASAVGSF